MTAVPLPAAHGVIGGDAMEAPAVHATVDVDETADLGPGTTVWHLAQIRENARLGTDCIVGRGAYVGPGVIIGDQVKLQNYALVYEPARLEDQVFIGPAVILTNDLFPRSADASGKLKRPADWEALGVVVRRGASVGARAVVLPGVAVGCWAMIAAAAVVTRDVPDFALVAGIPARRIGWVGRAGVKLAADGAGRWRCPQTGERYLESGETLTPLAGQA
jgi:UDP-2-acetamido-3-amino-2,3-dideoxy-glucuronate N-acetyltransferase